MSERRNPYHVLGLKKGASEGEIKEAYKVLARKHHPDRNPNDPGARERFIEIKEAYEALIERKSSSRVLSQVEETNAEFRRSGVYRRLFLGIGSVAALAVLGAAGFVFRADLDFHARRLAARDGDARAAESWLGPVASGGGPHAARARLELVRRFLAGEDREGAARVLATADDALGLAVLGDLHASGGRRDEARKAYERAIARAKDAETSARAYTGLLACGDESAAALVIKDAETRYASDPWTRWMAGVRALRAGKPDAALGIVQRMDSLAAKSLRAAALVSSARLLGDDLRRMEDRAALSDEALALLDASTPSGELGDFGWLFPRAELVRRRPTDWRPTTSLEDAETARDLARSAASSVRLTTEGFGAAIGYAKRAREKDQGSLEALLLLGAAHLARGEKQDDDAGQAKLAFAIARSTDDRSARAMAGYALAVAATRPDPVRMKADYEEELAAWRKAIELEPANAEWHFGHALSLARGGRALNGERIAANRRALRLDPAYGEPWLDLASALGGSEALKALQSATAVPDVASRAWKELGDRWYEARQYGSALAAYRNAANATDSMVQAQAWLGAARALGRLQRTKETYAALDRATALDPNLKLDRNDPALAALLPGYRPDPIARGDGAGPTALRVGHSHYERKLYAEAFAAYYQATTDESREIRAEAWHGIARCFAHAGNLHQAFLAMDRALRLRPDLPLDRKDAGIDKLLAAGYGAKGDS